MIGPDGPCVGSTDQGVSIFPRRGTEQEETITLLQHHHSRISLSEPVASFCLHGSSDSACFHGCSSYLRIFLNLSFLWFLLVPRQLPEAHRIGYPTSPLTVLSGPVVPSSYIPPAQFSGLGWPICHSPCLAMADWQWMGFWWGWGKGEWEGGPAWVSTC